MAAMLVPAASAATVIDFVGVTGGTLSYSGSGGINGSAIPIVLVQGIGTPANAGIHAAAALLNFSTGNVTFGGCSGGLCSYSWAAGGSISIVGSITGGPSGSLIVSGSFDPGTFSIASGGGLASFSGTGSDTKLPALLAYFGIGTTIPFNFAQFTIGVAGGAVNARTGAFSASANSIDVQNTATPEPFSVLILGTALVSAFVMLRRKLMV